ncbi:HxlR family transcriptional regulator [Aquimarina sp. MAR_2010_214]|uniref:winged helix-turn-helix transcriptional regulator n=1 Tax=Aquimarina sp. MAR_2010_214 TaxID=1250026 RepID=UPI000C6FE1C3|nr:helix-turn-helix domain-containing protein [Aquimarina sp. MAR_2010_214]PKV51733.1 HxlR family transcriptional regulator [Aquimarina sp. MAR_2010_214]
MKIQPKEPLSVECVKQLRAISDTMELLSGKWKIQIIGTLLRGGTMRFMELKRAIKGIAAKKLSSDLQELEVNKLITRTVKNTKPVTVEYTLTEHGKTLDNLIGEVIEWGINHRTEIIKK